MSDLERVREWLKTYNGMPDDMQIDFTHNDPTTVGLFSHGLQEVNRKTDIGGNVTVINQYNFTLIPIFNKTPNVDTQSTENAEWMMNFQKWIQEQSIMKKVPTFGNFDIDNEIIRAQNGMYLNDRDDGVGAYTVVLTIQFKNYYKGE